MSFLRNLFTPTQQVTQAPPAVPQGTTPQQQPTQATAPQPPQDTNPLDNFKDIWTAQPPAAESADPFAAPVISMDQQKFQQGLGQMSFTRGLAPEQVQKALSGDMESFMSILDHVGRQSFASAAQLQTATAEKAFSEHSQRVKNYIPNAFKSQQVQQAPVENDALNHPAMQPILQAARVQIMRTNPNLSPTEVARRAEEYIMAGYDAVNAGSAKTRQAAQASQQIDSRHDFSDYIG